MKFVSIVILATAVSVAGLAQGRREPGRASISDVSWLAGEWVSTAGSTTIEERWTPPAGAAMLAVGRTVNGGRLVEFEYLRIVEREGGLVYIAQPGGRPPTEFVLTMLSKDSATFENPAHDFPKVIRYTLRANGALEATISDGGQKARTFTFARRSK